MCPRCEGTGVCCECRGTGSVNCPICLGKAELVSARTGTTACRHCQGTGQISCSPVCASCDGKGEITAQLRQSVREKYTVQWDNTNPLSKVVRILAMLIGIGFAVQQYAPLEWRKWLYTWALNTDDGLPSGQVWRLLIPMFLHGGWMHVFCNAHFLWTHCPRLEGLYGSRRFLLIYFASGLGGSLLSWFGNCYLGHQEIAGWGASGALMGVATTYLGIYLRYRCVTKEEATWWLTFCLGTAGVGLLLPEMNLDNWGHLGGALCGLVVAMLTPRPTGR